MKILYAIAFLAMLQVSNAFMSYDSIGYKDQRTSRHLDNPGYTIKNFTTKLDHFAPWNNRTFQLRYSENNQYFNNDTGPIYITICGEQVCGPDDNSTTAIQMAIKLKAKLMTLEHRYYGMSQPFTNEEGGWSVENLKYLNSTQAIEDIHAFIEDLRRQYGSDRQIILLGGSYAGNLVAWYQQIYNDATAVWSSGAPVLAIEDFWQYDEVLWESASKSPGCAAILKNNTDTINQILNGMNKTQRNELFASNFHSDNEFVQNWFFTQMHMKTFQDGQRTVLCRISKNYNHTSDDPIQLYKDIFGPDAIQDLVSFMNGQYEKCNSTDVNNYYYNDRTWLHQICTEFGFFQTPNRNPDQRIVPAWFNKTTSLETCRHFGFLSNGTDPDTNYINKRYQSTNNTGDNIFFMTAIEDPWKHLQMQKLTEKMKTGSQKWYHIDCNDCAHLIDLRTPQAEDPEEVKAGRAAAVSTITQWVKDDTKKKNLIKQEEMMINLY